MNESLVCEDEESWRAWG